MEMNNEQKPVAWMSPSRERLEFSRADTVYGSNTIPLYTHPSPANEFNPDWDTVAPMVEEQKRMALRIEELEAELLGGTLINEGTKQKPVAWMKNLTDPQPRTVTSLSYCSVAEKEQGDDVKYIPVYTHPAPDVLRQLLTILGPTPPECCGCAYEWQSAIDLINGELG